jgi:REP element-mobilizing transposase RayT
VSQKQPTAVELSDFQPINPWKSRELVVRSRKLPHLEAAVATYFITFRCHAQFQLVPQARDLVMTVIQEQDPRTIDLDAAVVMADHVHAIFRVIEPYTLSRVLQRIKDHSSRQINLLLSRRGRVFSFLMRSVVGRPGRLSFPRGCREESRVFALPFRDSSRAPATRAGMTEGPYSAFPSVESVDHVIRHGQELEEKLEYIRQNPVKQGLEDSPGNYKWLFAREVTG